MGLRKQQINNLLLKYSGVIALILITILFACLSPSFRELNNISNIFFQTAVLAILGMGLTLVMITNNFDLSFASILIVSNVLAAYLLRHGFSVFLSSIITLGAGLVAGSINGVTVSVIGLNSIIATLGMKCILDGLALFITKGEAIWILNDKFIFIGQGSLGIVPVPFIITVFLAFLLIVLTFHTRFGMHASVIGGNIEAARFTGIKVTGVTFMMYLLCGLISSLGGIVQAAQAGMGSCSLGGSYMLDGFAIVYLGQGIFKPGESQIPGTLVGALLIVILNSGMTMLNIQYYTQYAIKGFVIILAIALSMYLKKTSVFEKQLIAKGA